MEDNRKLWGAALLRKILWTAIVLATFAVPATVPRDAEASYTCVQYARSFSGIEIYGDAWTWWHQKKTGYKQGQTPTDGAVLVFKRSGKMIFGHVGVVVHQVSDRDILINHANWALPGERKGQIRESHLVRDVSKAGDWSAVRVWYPDRQAFGRVYPTYGFIYPSRRV
jgi:surface antigen